MKQKIALLVSGILLCSLALSVAQEDRLTLNNGLEIITLPNTDGGLISCVLVCPLPPNTTQEELADIALINRLIWHGGSAMGTTTNEIEFQMLALRFGGSISSQIVPDALIIQYTLPSELLSEILKQLTVQWGGFLHHAERLAALKQEIKEQEKTSLISSVRQQLLREITSRLWIDFHYANVLYGSESALESADSERIFATFKKLRNPGNWSLLIKGAQISEELKDNLESTLGTIPVQENAEEEPLLVRAGPRLGITLQLPAELSANHAILAFRLPPSNELNTESLLVLAETIRRSPQLKALKDDLSEGTNTASVSVGLEIRQHAGMIYFSASWNSGITGDEVVDRLKFLAIDVAGSEHSAEAFEAARKTMLIRYWNRYMSSAGYAFWRGIQLSVGVSDDTFAPKVETLTSDSMANSAKNLFTQENSLTLITVAK